MWLRIASVTAAVAACAAAAPAAAAPAIDIRVEPRVRLDRPVTVRGVTGETGRVVVVVRNANGRVIGRVVRDRVAKGAFGVGVALNDAARPGAIRVSALLTGAGAFPPARDEVASEIVKIEPNFLAAFPAVWPRTRPLPARGRLAFPGRLVIVVRDGDGHPLGRAIVEKARRGGFTTAIRLSAGAKAGRVTVTGTLRSGSLVARGKGVLRLT